MAQADEPPEASKTRRYLSALVRLLVVAAAFGWLISDPKWKWSELLQVLRTANWRIILLSILAFGPAPVLIAIRLKWLLAVHDIRLRVWDAIRVTFAGNFLISALPVGTSGGDAAKAFLIARDTPQKHEAITTVFFDRVVGVVGLVLTSGLMVLLNWRNPALAHWGRPIGIVALLFFAGAAAYYSDPLRRVSHLDALMARLPLAGHVQRFDRALLAFRHHAGVLGSTLGLTFVLQGVAIFSFFLTGWGLGIAGEHPWRALPIYLAYVPICFLTGALPIGVMEVTFVQLFSVAAGLGSPEAAVSLSLVGRLTQLIWALPGALVVLRGSRIRGEVAPGDDRGVQRAEGLGFRV